MPKLVDIPKEKLFDLYIIQNMRRGDIAEMFGVKDVTIKKKLQKFVVHLNVLL